MIGRASDVRHWCEKLRCTENELRDTVKAVMRLMAHTSSHAARHH
jgi:hypothetical protein